jgi:hypothetical protein
MIFIQSGIVREEGETLAGLSVVPAGRKIESFARN